MRKSILFPHLFQLTHLKLGFFLYIDQKIRNNLTSNWKKSGQQTAFNHASGRPVRSVDLVWRSSKLSKIAIVLNTSPIVNGF